MAPQQRHRNTKWIQVDVKQALVNWMSSPDKKFGVSKKIGLIIEAVDANGKPSSDVSIETASTDLNNVSTLTSSNFSIYLDRRVPLLE